jgi:hypothetical protein
MTTYAIASGHKIKMFIKTSNLALVEVNSEIGDTIVETEYSDNPANYILIDGIVTPIPDKPSEYHVFDYTNLVWTDTRTVEMQWNIVREQRNKLLSLSDWTDTLSAPSRLGEILYNQWQVYRQALRDVTNQSDPFNITWPTPP